jgi:hypothetical protein
VHTQTHTSRGADNASRPSNSCSAPLPPIRSRAAKFGPVRTIPTYGGNSSQDEAKR